MGKLKDKVAIVTGASKGIGAAIEAGGGRGRSGGRELRFQQGER